MEHQSAKHEAKHLQRWDSQYHLLLSLSILLTIDLIVTVPDRREIE